MPFNEVNSHNASQPSQFRTMFRTNAGEDFLSINKLIEQCSKFSVTIIQLPDKRLQAGLNILPLKAKFKENSETVVIFITKFNEKKMTVTAYFEGNKIETTNATTEEEIAKLIKKWVQSRKLVQQDYQKQGLTMIQKLTKKCGQMAKREKNQLMAIQKLKSTKEYTTLVEHQIQLSMQIESLSQLLMKLEKEIQNRNDLLLEKILPIEALKNQIEEYQYEYEETGRCFRNVKEQLGEYLQKQQEKVQNMEITSQAQLNLFLTEAKLLKKLQLQKRFLL